MNRDKFTERLNTNIQGVVLSAIAAAVPGTMPEPLIPDDSGVPIDTLRAGVGCVTGDTMVLTQNGSQVREIRMDEVVPLFEEDIGGCDVGIHQNYTKIVSYNQKKTLIPLAVVSGGIDKCLKPKEPYKPCIVWDEARVISLGNGRTITSSREHPFNFISRLQPFKLFDRNKVIEVRASATGEIEENIYISIADRMTDKIYIGSPTGATIINQVIKKTHAEFEEKVYNLIVASADKVPYFINKVKRENPEDLQFLVDMLVSSQEEFGLETFELLMVNEGVYSGTLNLQSQFSIEESLIATFHLEAEQVVLRTLQ